MGHVPLRLPVLAESDNWIALDKPAGLAMREYPWDGKCPNLDAALNVQLQAEKPELMRRGATMFGSVYYLDPEISGVALFAKSRDALSELKNRFGSGECTFRFIFVAGPRPVETEAAFTADAPLLPHNVKPKMIPSSAKGKKSSTDFKQLGESEYGWTLWEAKVTFFRPHHIRAHAAVHGLPVLGDAVYEGPEAPLRRDLLPRKKGGGLSAPAFEGLALHLASCDIVEGSVIQASLPHSFNLFLKRLGLADALS